MLFFIVSRGKNAGIRLSPHRLNNGMYRVSETKQGRHVWVRDEDEIKSYLSRGYSLRMSNKSERHPPSLISPESIQGWR